MTTSPSCQKTAGHRATVRRLTTVQKTVKGAPAYSRFVNRPLGRHLAALAFHGGLTPNQLTAISALFSFGAIATLALARPTPGVGVGVCAALVVGYAFDAADGQLARLRGGGTAAGEWLDHMVDCAKISSLHLAVAVSFYRFSGFGREDLGRGPYLLVPIGYAIVAAVTFFGMIAGELLRRIRAAADGTAVPVATGASVVRSLLVLPTDYGLVCLVFLLLGWGPGFATVYALMGAASTAFLLMAAVKWYRELAALGPVSAAGPVGAAGAVVPGQSGPAGATAEPRATGSSDGARAANPGGGSGTS